MKIGLLIPTAFECEALPDLGIPVIRGSYGPGKAAAACATAQLIHAHGVDAVLVWGLAGGVAAQVKIGDVVVAERVAYHDYDIAPLMGAMGVGEAPGFSIGEPWVALDAGLAAIAHAHLRLALPNHAVHAGKVASGDRFVQLKHPEDRNAIVGAALAVEMEGAAVAHACALHGAHGGKPVRVCMVRIVSDSADGDAHFDFAETAKALHALNRGVLPGLVAALGAPSPSSALKQASLMPSWGSALPGLCYAPLMPHSPPWKPPAQVLAEAVKTYPNFPVAGVMFKDIWPLLADPLLFRLLLDELVAQAQAFAPITHVAGIESRGFILAHALAQELRLPFVPIRKPGKLPGQVEHCAYTLEYGQSALEMQVGVLPPGARCLLVDDVLATGGTALAAAKLIKKLHAIPAGLLVVGEVAGLDGRHLVMRETHVPVAAVLAF